MIAKPAAPRTLLRVLGIGFGIAVLVGNTIGSGILRNPGEVAGHLPSVALFLGVWIAGGIYALLGSNALAEVSAMTPESGGYTVFVRRGLGPYFGFVAGWSDWLSTCSSASAAAIVIAESINVLAGRTRPSGVAGRGSGPPRFSPFCNGAESASREQHAKRNQPLEGAGVSRLCRHLLRLDGQPERGRRLARSCRKALPLFVALVLAMQAVIFTYDGWVGPAYFAGELRDPGRELPRSIFGGVIAVIVIYLLVNVALLHVLPIGRLAHDPFAAGTVASIVFGPQRRIDPARARRARAPERDQRLPAHVFAHLLRAQRRDRISGGRAGQSRRHADRGAARERGRGGGVCLERRIRTRSSR